MTRTKRRSCDGKYRYTSKRKAIEATFHRLERYTSYHCKFCGGWHIGHYSRVHGG